MRRETIRMDTLNSFSPQASLVMVGHAFQKLGIWSVIERQVKIKQKVRRYTPTQKLLDAFINMLAGGQGLVEVNTRVRTDQLVQLAFGRDGCAEQSTISDTFSAASLENVQQLRAGLKQILRRHGQCAGHNYRRQYQLLDVDLTGLRAGASAEGATTGYFADRRQRRGRQLGRVLATRTQELVVERLYEGKRQLDHTFQGLVLAAEDVLDLAENKRKRTILRADGGAGDDANINWTLTREYYLLTKVRNWQRAYKLAQTVKRWYADPKVADRQLGWVQTPARYARSTRQVAVRHPKKTKTGQVAWHYHVLVFNLTDAMLFQLSGQPQPCRPTTRQRLLAAAYAYDLRDGGLETQNRGDKQGLGLSKRNKRSLTGQEMLILLAQLAHNLVIWSRDRLAVTDPRFRHYGVQRVVRDLFQISGHVTLTAMGQIKQVVLNPDHPYAAAFQKAFGDDW